jgi:mannose/cellobiose epimerase-like protein (N-acyl-D-glucosamine 2-epimerase family)
MTAYVETFHINDATYGIEDVGDGFFKCWKSGCAIYTADDIAAARKILHQYACSQARAEIGTYQRLVDRATSALEKLGNDPFNLGRFRV